MAETDECLIWSICIQVPCNIGYSEANAVYWLYKVDPTIIKALANSKRRFSIYSK
ncbi:hypothetical protein HanPSC8_Chr01g0003461 [Helianthus annuus]|nr:hypothetical protein HanPSC8_Chr01g0003461 [Helianthus annuus]